MLVYLFFAGNLTWSIVKGPLEPIVGVIYGIFVGVLIWFIPAKTSVSTVESLEAIVGVVYGIFFGFMNIFSFLRGVEVYDFPIQNA